MLWILGGVLFIVALVLTVSYICFRMAFYVDRSKQVSPDMVDLPAGEVYRPFLPFMEECAKEVRAMPYEALQTTSFDGLPLYGRYYEYAPGAPIELMMHGYRGSAERDLSGGVRRAFALGHSVLLVDQRCSGKSGGNVITFGIHESKDCLSWLEKMGERFGPDARIILTGISMGASTVLNAAGQKLPDTVIGVLADCGFTSPKEIIQVVIKDMGLPPKLSYPFVKLGAQLFGRFDLEELESCQEVKKATVPVIFFHGEDDAFVPCYMSKQNYDACPSRKALVTIPGAGHGLSYPVAKEQYLQAMREFFGE